MKVLRGGHEDSAINSPTEATESAMPGAIMGQATVVPANGRIASRPFEYSGSSVILGHRLELDER